ncbi:MAG: hypothetical protein QM477_07535 [Planctomycetota bacterium]
MRRLLVIIIVLLALIVVMWKDEPATAMPPFAERPAPTELESAPTVADARRPQLERQQETVKEEIEALPEEEFLEWEEAEPEPVELGSSALELHFFDAATQLPVSGTIELWRLAVGAFETWTAGDQKQYQGESVDGRLLIDQLPEGWYRIYVLNAVAGSATEEAFEVQGAFTFVERFVKMPGEEDIHLLLFHPDGSLLRSTTEALITIKARGSRSKDFLDRLPPWVEERMPRGNLCTEASALGGGYGMSLHQSWKELEFYPDGFFIGSLRQDNRMSYHDFRFKICQGEEQPMGWRCTRRAAELMSRCF